MNTPTPPQMRDFAQGFTDKEWNYLCSNSDFINAMQSDLSIASVISIILLTRFYSLDTKIQQALSEIISVFQSIGMNDRVIAAHLQHCAATLLVSSFNGGDGEEACV